MGWKIEWKRKWIGEMDRILLKPSILIELYLKKARSLEITSIIINLWRINMREIEKKFEVLSKIAKELNDNNITWAIGASLLLYIKGISSEFHDIDIMVAERDVQALKNILLPLGELQSKNPNIQYKTKQFLEFKVEGVDIDVMAGFVIVNKGRSFYFPLDKDNIMDYTEINGVKIPLQSVKEWRKYYELMGRTEKVKMIDDKFVE